MADKDELTKRFGARLRELRQESGRLLDSFAGSAGDPGRLSRIERGLVSPTLRTVELLAHDLDVDPVDLLIDPDILRHELIAASREASHTRLLRALKVLAPAKRRFSKTYRVDPARSPRRSRRLTKAS